MSDNDLQKKDHKKKEKETEAIREAQDWRGQYASPEKIKEAIDRRDSKCPSDQMANDEGIEAKGASR